MLAEMVGEVVIVTLLVSEGDQVVIVVMGLLMDKVEEVEMALTAISLETTVEGVVTVVHQGKAVTMEGTVLKEVMDIYWGGRRK